jgi:3-phenylpropionate/trans-cinnamate dioxygenase ferredoxin subunit
LAEVDVAPLEELPPGTMKLVERDSVSIGVYNCEGELHAIEDRCSHDDGPLCHGNWDAEECKVFCPRHGASFDLKTGKALSLPAYLPARTFPVRVEDGIVKVEIADG